MENLCMSPSGIRYFALACALAGLLSCAVAADFTRWRGTNSNGSAGDTAMPLVKSWDDAGVAWVSEVKSPHPWNTSIVRGKTQWPRTVLANGGYCEPTLWDGKVYVAFYRPAGTEFKPDTDPWTRHGLDAYSLAKADEVIVCMDAATGRTLWEAVWPLTEENKIEAYGGHNNACVADGRVYAISNGGNLYCADARTGKRLWMTGITGGGVITAIPEPPQPPHPLGGSLDGTTYNCCPVVADGVVVTGGMGGRTSLVGFDAVTGKRLWANTGAIGGLVPPLRWVHEGKEYLICAAANLQCIEPKTGAVLWTGDVTGNDGYGAATPAIDGDLIVVHGPSLKKVAGLPPDNQKGWICYRLSPTGAKEAWALSSAYIGTGYTAAIIHRGYAWLQFVRAKDAVGLGNSEDARGKTSFVCVEMATGKVVSEVNNVPLVSVCPGPMAMGDLLAYQSDQYVWLIDISDPAAPRYLGMKRQPSNYCSSITGADGFLYFRSAERLVVCLDVRKPEARPAIARHDDPKNARFDLTLDEGQRDGGTPRFFLRGRDGAFPQSWATVPEDYSYPDVVYPDSLSVADGKLAGKVSALLRGIPYTYNLSATLKDGVVEGEYEDTYHGIPIRNDITGTAVARAARNAVFTLSWPRQWVDGQNQGVEHKLYLTLTDGVITKVQLLPRLPRRPDIHATTESFDLQFKDNTLTGFAILQVNITGAGISGRYRVDFDMALLNNLFSGTVQSTRDGFASTTYSPEGFTKVNGGGERPTTTHPAWGDAQVAAAEPFAPANAVYTLDLRNSLIKDNDTDGFFDTRLYVTVADGKVIGATANARGTAGLQRADASGVRLEGNRLKGRVDVWVNPDGYVFRSASHNVYNIDAKIDGNTAEGTYEGTYDWREVHKGRLFGTYVNE
jgi:outer membrane protein assembly factor BamB